MPREQRERLILEVAGQVFARAGYDSASMDEIAELVGVSKPILYAYFGSKEGLYLAYIERAGRELVERLVGAWSRGAGSASRLRAPVVEFLAFVEERDNGWRVLFREAASSRPLAEQVAVLRGRIVDAIREMVESSSADSPPPASDAVAHVLVGAGESLANWWLDHREVPRADVAGWYLGVVQAVLAGTRAGRAQAPEGLRGL
ncbi:MAG: TetR/AcrR family transcriptional regulator [Solirubrobacterales bacterium]|nr:TetR/AcrR family transcriptional regulator [Solirubrobacterales bacterium]